MWAWGLRSVAWLAVWAGLVAAPALAAGPVETSVFAVQGVAVDVTDTHAADAKNKALVEAVMKAFPMLAERLGTPALVADVAKMDEKQVMPYLKSLSIEEESMGPGHYMGKITVRFLPQRIKALYGQYGVKVNASQAAPILVLPLWNGPEGPQLWEDNPWRTAWVNLHAEQDEVPIIVPLGDDEDQGAISPAEAMAGDRIKLEALRRRYDVKTVLVATGTPAAEGGVRAQMKGETDLGTVSFDKVYTGDVPGVEAGAVQAARRFHDVMTEKFHSNEAKAVAAAEAARQAKEAARTGSLPVSVPFTSPTEWNGLRARILSTPGVTGVDVTTLAGDGAVIRLMFVGGVENMQSSFQASGLTLVRAGESWIIQSM
jgi:hypothetical protein